MIGRILCLCGLHRWSKNCFVDNNIAWRVCAGCHKEKVLTDDEFARLQNTVGKQKGRIINGS